MLSYLLFVFLIPLLGGLLAQFWLKRTVKQQSQVAAASGLTGAQVARRVLDSNGLQSVPVQRAGGSALSDHYNPSDRSVNLSAEVYDQASVTAAAIAAHEVGHAIQHATAWKPMQLRAAMWPAVAISSNLWIWLLLAGVVLQAAGLVFVAIALYGVAVLFHFVTLPVEFDASRRAGQQLNSLGLIASGPEQAGVQKVLTAAALTYVVAALAALVQLGYFVLSYLSD